MIRLPVLALALAMPLFASAAELTTLDGKKVTGEITAITANELTFKSMAGEEKFAITAISSVTLGPSPKPLASGTKHSLVELNDGSSFRCASVAFRGPNVELSLLGMPARKLDVSLRNAVFSINREAGDLKLEQDFRQEVARRGKFDRFVRKRSTKSDEGKTIDQLDGIPGTFGVGAEDGTTIEFTPESTGVKGPLRVSQVAGMIVSAPPGRTAPPAICKVIDVDGNEYVAQSVARNPNGFTVTLVSGVKVELATSLVSTFDFAAGSVKYLSDLDPVAVEHTGTEPHKYQRDKNLDRQPITLYVDAKAGKKETFPKGLSFHARTMIVYELKGQYKTFRAIAGVDADEETSANSAVRVTIDDGTNVLFKGVIKTGDKLVDLNLNVQGVDRLKIVVESEGMGEDLGNQVTLASARVLK